jgi:hypothetical protein
MRRRGMLLGLGVSITGGCLRFAGGGQQTISEGDQGRFEIRVADENGTLQTVVTGEHVEGATAPEERDGNYRVAIILTDEGTRRYREKLEEYGVLESPRQKPIFTYLRGDEIKAMTLSRALARTIAAGEWQGDFVLTLEDESLAERVHEALSE